MIAEERYLQGAETFARAAALLGMAGQAAQARKYGTQAAEQYLKGGDRLAAAQQYLQAAEVWLNNYSTPELTIKQLEQAYQLAIELGELVLQIRILRAQAWLAFATRRSLDVKRLWEQIKELIPQVVSEAERVELWRSTALQYAAFAMVWEESNIAKDALETALAACPETAYNERLDLLQNLLLVSTERGDWPIADRIYQEAQQLLNTVTDPKRSGLLAMHYGASLARRGALPEAYDSYSLALQQLDGQADAYTLGLAYQNMQYMLQRNGMMFFPDFGQHEARRIDLFYSTQTQDRGYAHELRATAELSAGNYRGAIQHIRLALVHYWRKGAWAGIAHTYEILARLNAAIDKPVEALLAAIRTSNLKAVEQYSETLRDNGSVEQLAEVIDHLIKIRPAACEQQVAIKALGILADFVSPTLLKQVVNQLVMLLQGPENNNQDIAVRRHSAEALRHLVPQLTPEQTNLAVQVTLDQLPRRQFWTIIEELLEILNECFMQRQCQVDPSLYEPVAKAMLDFSGPDHLRELTERVASHLARTASSKVRERVVAYLRERSDQFDHIVNLAFLKEPISEEQLNRTIEQILQAINPQPVATQQGIVMGFGGITPRALNHFNEMLPASLHNRVIDGLLEAIINENNPLSTRSEAIWALSDLPTEVLAGRADEVAEYLMWGAAKDSLPRSAHINWELASQTDPFSSFRMNTGNIPQVRRSCLRALGHLYTHLNTDNQKSARTHLIIASRDSDPVVRQGVGMALRATESAVALETRLLLALVVLLHNPEPGPCSWACVASGYLIVRGLADPFAEDLIEQLINLADPASKVEVRVGAAIGLRMLAWSEQLDETMHQQVLQALEKLSNDVNFRVRREATATKSESSSDKG